jgi:hypothetical protein
MLSLLSRFSFGCIALALGVSILLIVPMNDVQRALCALLAIVPVALFPASIWGVLIFTAAVVDFSLTTGWQFVSEFDAVILLALGTAYLRTIMEKTVTVAPPALNTLFISLCFIFMIAALRVWVPAPRWDGNALNNMLSSWFAVYQGKPYLYALLALPVLARTVGKTGRRVGWSVVAGSWCAMFAISLLALWERYTFTSILNFASDYRITVGTSSMHTGSGALDAFIALAFPASMVLLFDRRPALQFLGLLSFPLFTYTAFVTFSRGLQLGLVAGAGCAAVLFWFARRRARSTPGERGAALKRVSVLGVGLFIALALLLWMFPSSGYRGALALGSSFFAIYLAFARPLALGEKNRFEVRHLRQREFIAIGLGLFLALGVIVFAGFVKKLPYMLHAAFFTLSVIAALWATLTPRGGSSFFRMLARIFAIGLLGTTVSVAVYWGENAAAFAAMGAAFTTLLGAIATRSRALAWTHSRERTIGLTVSILCAAGLAAGLNASFFKARASSSAGDLQGRANHWRDSLVLGSETLSDTLIGKGAGRFFAEYALRGARDKPASFWWTSDGAGGRLRLLAGKYKQGYGELLRFNQRVARPTQQPYNVVLHVVPDEKPTVVEVTLCEKLLLTSGDCGVVRVRVPAASSATTQNGFLEIKEKLSELPLTASKLWRPYVLSVGLETDSRKIELLSVQVIGQDGKNILRNSDFHEGLSHWFPSTDAFHLPWHTHNWAIAAWFDAGLVGLFAWIMVLAGSLVSVWSSLFSNTNRGARLRIAAIFGGVAGAMAVGLVDSLTDIPRVTFWLLLLCACAVAMATRQRSPKRVSENFTKQFDDNEIIANNQ